MANKIFSYILSKIRFLIPASIAILFIILALTYFSFSTTKKTINSVLEKNIDLEVETVSKMFEREYDLKLNLVKNHLNVMRYLFYNNSFEISNNKTKIKAINQISGEEHLVEISNWYLNSENILSNYSLVDTLKSMVAGTATIFQKIDSGYIRISTNVTNNLGERAIGTFIPNNSPVIKTIEQRKIYYGRAFVVNKWYITAYEPIIKDNKIIGIIYVGNEEKDLKVINEIISKIKIGKSGFVFVCDQSGKIIINTKNKEEIENNKQIISKIVSEKSGFLKYKSINNNTLHYLKFKYYSNFDLIICADIDENSEIGYLLKKQILISTLISLVSLLFFAFITGSYSYLHIKKSNKKIDFTRKALREAERKFRTIFDNGSDEIYVADLKGNFIEVNKVACSVLGYSYEEFLKMNFRDIKTPKYVSKVNENIELILKNKSNIYETEQVTKDGKVLNVEMKSRLIQLGGKEVIMSIARNIDDRKEIEKKIISTVIKTEEKERKRFAADLHDELGPILSTIKLYSDLLKSRKHEDPKNIELADDIDNLTNIAISTARDLSNRITPSILHDFGLAVAIKEFVNYINKTKSLKIELNTDNYEKIEDSFTETILFQVCKELINNTLKHGKANNIIIELKVLNKQLILYYKDDGIGFEFEQMLDNSQGLGLKNIVNKIKTIKGNCDFGSRPGNGMFVIINIKV